MGTEQCGGSTTKEDSGGTTEDGGITVVVAMTMAGIAVGEISTIHGMVQTRVSTTSRIGRRNGETTSKINSSSVTVMVVADGRETPEEEDSGMVAEGVRRMTGSRVQWGMVVRSRNRRNLHRHR